VAKILLVEDDFSLRDIYSARLQADSHAVVTASDGEEALAVAMREHPDLIVLDVMMPKISGFDVLDILRSTPETKTTKVIMMTALSQDADRQRGESLGVNKYLVKSQVTLEDVMAAVKQVLGEGSPSASAATTPEAATPASTTSAPAPAPVTEPQAASPAPEAAPAPETAADEAPAPVEQPETAASDNPPQA
jgi:DNA-binding response OmpR family regulator